MRKMRILILLHGTFFQSIKFLRSCIMQWILQKEAIDGNTVTLF